MKWALIFAAALVYAQEPSKSTLAGKVVSSGKPVPGAEVEWRSGETVLSTVTGEDGTFHLDAPPLAGKLTVKMFGFASATVETPAGPSRSEAIVQLSVNGIIERPVLRAAERSPEQPQNGNGNGSEEDVSLLIQGSISRGLSEQNEPDAMAMFMRGGFGMLMPGGMPEMSGMAGPGPGGLPQPGAEGSPAGGMGGRGGGPMGGAPGGPGGGPGGMMGGPPGGPGGMMGGPPGMGGPGGRRGPGGEGGFDPRRAREMVANLSPEEREKFRQALQQRMGRMNEREGFGNRRTSRRQQIRGMAFFSLRDAALDATPFSVNGRAVEKPDYWQTRFGGSIGGGITSRSFFFVNYNGVRGSNPWSGFATVPDSALRSGNFAGANPIYDPLSGSPFAGNVIPQSRIDPIAQGLNSLIPQPNATGSIQNYKFITTIPSSSDMLSARFNQTLKRRNRLGVNVSYQRRRSNSPQMFGWVDENGGTGFNMDVSWSQSLSSRLIHQVRARYNFNGNFVRPFFSYGRDWSGELGIQGNSRDPVNYGPPNLNFTNLGDLTDGGHSDRRNMSYVFSDSWTIVRGRHSLTTGFEFTRTQWNNFAETDARGTLFFGGLVTSGFDAGGLPIARTGVDYADFLLGAVQQSTLRYGGADTYLRGSTYGAFIQDEFRVNRSLTLNLGARYDQWRPYTEKYARMANVSWSLSPPAAAVVTSAAASEPALVSPDLNNIAPRAGFAWRPSQKKPLIIRGGYSLFYDSSAISRIPTRLAAQPPFATTSTFNTSTANVLTLARPFAGPADVTIRNTLAVNPDYPLPYAQTWNLSVQYTLRGYVIETSYIGTKGTRLMMLRIPNRAPTGSPVDSESRRPIENAVGFSYESPEGNAIFHAGQVRVVRRLRRGVSWNALYAWSKSIDNASTIGGAGNIVVQDDNNFRAERGLSSFDVRHNASFDTMLESPFGKTGIWLKDKSLLSSALTDWTATLSLSMRTGNPLTARVLGNAADAAGTGATGSARASATGLPVNAGDGYFNTAAFTLPAAGQYGNAGRGTIPGPGFFMLNAGLGRSIQIGDDSRHRLEARIEANNVLNHPNITGLGTTVNAVNYGLATNAGNMRTMQFLLRFRF